MNQNKHILITGAAGFIGSNASEYFLNQGYSVDALDNMGPGSNEQNITNCLSNPEFSFAKLDLRNSKLVTEYVSELEKLDYVLHLAAESHVDRSLEDSSSFWDTQVRGTFNLLQALVSCKNTPSKVINQITDEVYGEIEKETPSAKETDPFLPRPPYACSKAAQFFVGKSFFTTGQLPIISTFPVNNFGPKQAPEKIIPRFVTLLLADKKVPLMASTHFERDWLPVIDMCRAFDTIFKHGIPGEGYNVGADNHRSNIQLTKELLSILNKDESYIEIVPDRVTHDSRYAVDSTKLRSLGWKPQENFLTWLEHTVNWYGKETIK